MSDTTAWLIECGENPTLYFAADGDWCSNPNHAHKFPSADDAHQKMMTMTSAGAQFRVADHRWMSDEQAND